MVIDCIPLPTLFRTVDYEKTHDPHLNAPNVCFWRQCGFLRTWSSFPYSFERWRLGFVDGMCDLVSLYDSGLMIG
jgi:hypothetical protein